MVTILSGTSRPAVRPAPLRQVIVSASVVLAALAAAPAIGTAISMHPHHAGITTEHARCWKQAHRAGRDPGLCTGSPAGILITRP